MKTSNIKFVKSLAYSYIILIFFLLLVMVFFRESTLLLIVLCTLVCVLFINLVKLRFTEIDNGGECFTVRKMHPFVKKGYYPPKIEFPFSAIRNFEIQNGMINCYIKIKIQSRTIKKNIYITVHFCNSKQLAQLKAYETKD